MFLKREVTVAIGCLTGYALRGRAWYFIAIGIAYRLTVNGASACSVSVTNLQIYFLIYLCN